MVLIRFFIEIIEAIFTGGILAIFDGLSSLIGNERKKIYDADFINGKEDDLLTKENDGFCLDGKRFISLEDSTKGVLISASTGGYKSSAIIIPSILKLRHRSSMVILDPSKTLLGICSKPILDADGEVKVVDFKNPACSEGYNPIDPAWAKTASDYLKVSKMLVSASLGSGGKDPIWNIASEGIICFSIKFIVTYTEKEYHNLYQVYHFLSAMAADPDAVDLRIAETNDHALLLEYRAFLSYGKMLNSIIATSRSALSIFGTDPDVARVTSHNTITVSDFRERKISLFINTSTGDIQYYAALTSLMFQQFFGEIMKDMPTEDDKYISFIIDEASSLKFDLQGVSSNIRKYRCTLLHAYQSAHSQLTDLYGAAAARAIIENCYTKIYAGGGMTNQVASEIEATLGKFEYQDEKGVRQVKSLMSTADIRESKKAFIFIGNNRAIHTPLVPYFKQPKLVKITNGQPFIPENKYVIPDPPLLQI